MKQIPDDLKTFFDTQPLWYVGTCSTEPNVAVIGFKGFLDDGRILLCDVFMKHTLEDVKANGKVSITACDPEKMAAYMISGTAEYFTESEHLENWKAIASAMSGGKLAPKGVVIITPEKIRNMSANAHNGQEL